MIFKVRKFGPNMDWISFKDFGDFGKILFISFFFFCFLSFLFFLFAYQEFFYFGQAPPTIKNDAMCLLYMCSRLHLSLFNIDYTFCHHIFLLSPACAKVQCAILSIFYYKCFIGMNICTL